MQAIYKPKGAAEEYCEYAVNIFPGCTHRCVYCCARDYHNRFVRPKTGKEFWEDMRPRDGIVEAVEAQLRSGDYKDKLIHLCFTCDPYPHGVDDYDATRKIIRLIKDYGSHVQILTKGGMAAIMDRDLLDKDDWFGVTISCGQDMAKELEPLAGQVSDRIVNLSMMKDKGISTWVSCEPVYEPEYIYKLIVQHGDIIDLFRIGKLNHRKSDIDWKEFGNKCEELCIRYGRKYEIKDGLRKEMEG